MTSTFVNNQSAVKRKRDNMFEQAKKGEVTTVVQAIKLMIQENPSAKYDFKLYREYALNAVDDDFYSPSEIKALIKKLSTK